MKDNINRLNEIKKNNDEVFQRIDEASKLGRTAAGVSNVAKTVLKGTPKAVVHKGGNRFEINGNPVEYLYINAAINTIINSPNWESTWKWLLEGKYVCRYLSLEPDRVVFSGDWLEGDCRANSFQDTTSNISRFLGGRFIDGKYQADNGGFGKENPSDALPGVSAEAFISGTYSDNKEGIFGYKDWPDTQEGYEMLNLIQIPVGQHLILNKGLKSEAGFRLLKRIDEKSSVFSFKSFPNEKTVNITWEDMRLNFVKYNFIRVGQSFELPGIVKIRNIKSIHIQKIYQYVQQNVVVFPMRKSPELNKMKLGINLNVPVRGKMHKQKITGYEQALYDNSLPDMFRKIKEFKVNGYYGFPVLSPLFNNQPGTQGILPAGANQWLGYLAEFFEYVVNHSPQKDKFVAALKNYLEIPQEAGDSTISPEVTVDDDELTQKYVAAEKEKMKKTGRIKES